MMSYDASLSFAMWLFLIYMSRTKRVQLKRAGTHFWFVFFAVVWRISTMVISLTGLGEYSEPLSAMLSSCTRTAFRSLTCAPLGILLFLPVAEILTLLCAAFTIRHRAVARHGVEKVEVPPPPPKLAAAWTLGDVVELDGPAVPVVETIPTKEFV
ncbi:hypothetical protein B0H13DRAFT_1985619 [Mycena leptocephala]|nr:hypothetical protein B0H13DRAFT_1985619 [Mycena leptocephala]